MNRRTRVGAFALSAAILLALWLALVVAKREPGNPPDLSGPRAVDRPTVVATNPPIGPKPVPPGAWRVARRFARVYAGVRGGRLVGLADADDPGTPDLEVAARLERGPVLVTVTLVLGRRDGAWRVATVR